MPMTRNSPPSHPRKALRTERHSHADRSLAWMEENTLKGSIGGPMMDTCPGAHGNTASPPLMGSPPSLGDNYSRRLADLGRALVR